MRQCMRCGKELPEYLNRDIYVCAYGCDSKELYKVLEAQKLEHNAKEKSGGRVNGRDR